MVKTKRSRSSANSWTKSNEIIDLLQGGQGVFGIAVGKVWHEVEGSLSVLQSEVNGQVIGGQDNDELSLRRKSKGA